MSRYPRTEEQRRDWFAGDPDGDTTPIVSGGVVIASVINDDDLMDGEYQRNIDLFEAAPSLLNALKHLVVTARTFRNVPPDQHYWSESDDAALDAAFAAIARAEPE